MKYLLSVDCGLTVGKAAVFDAAGCKYSEAKTGTPLNGFSLNAEELWMRLAGCVRQAIEQSPARACDIAAVGLAGHGNGLYALDGEGQVAAAISPMYDGNQALVDEFRKSSAYERYFEMTRQSCWGGQPMQILRHMKREQPDVYSRIRTVFNCKDLLRWKLTGTKGTDYSDFSVSALAQGNEGHKLCRLMGLEELETALPKPIPCDSIAGFVTDEAARATGLAIGTPVAAGGVDLFACMLGSGIAEAGCCSVTAGTWGITAALSQSIDEPSELTQVCSFHPALEQAAIVSAPTSCVNLEWFLKNVCPNLNYEEANAAALAFAPGDVNIIYLPYIYRDMARPETAGAFRNLSAGDTWREMVRSIYEGVCFGHRLHLDRLRLSGVSVDRIRLSGGATNSEAWCRLMCDILDTELEIPCEKQAGLLGVAMMAASAAGIHPDLRTACHAMSSVEKRYRPKHDVAYDDKYAQFLKMAGEGQ